MELNDHGIAAAAVAYQTALEGVPHTTGNMLHAMRKAVEGYVDASSKPPPAPRCMAVQHSDQMQCGRCGLAWDINDPDRPACVLRERRLTVRRQPGIEPAAWVTDAGGIKFALNVSPVPGMKFYTAPTAYFQVGGFKIRLDAIGDDLKSCTLRVEQPVGPDSFLQFGRVSK